jgi:AsmA protein
LKRLTKTLLALVGLFVVAIVLILLFVNANSFRPAIEKQLTATLGRDVKLGKVSLSLFSWSLIVRDLSIADDPAFSSAPFLTATEVRIGISLWPLIFSHQLNIRSFQIEAPQIIVIRAANGAWNFSSLGRLPASGDSARDANAQSASGISKGAVPQLPDHLFIGRIVIEAGHAVIGSLPAQGPPRVYEHVNLTARDFSFASQFAIEGGATLAAGGTIRGTGHVGPINRDDAATSPIDAQISVKHFDPVATGFIDTNTGVSLLADIDMHAASDGQTLTTGGAVHIQNLKLRKNAAATPKPLTITYRGTYRAKENTGQIEDAAVKIGDAAIHANGTFQTITHGTEYPILNLKLAGQNLSIDELQPLMSAAAIRLPNDSMLKGGTLSMNLTITGPAKSLDVTAPITLANTHLVGFDSGSKIHGIAALSGIKTGDTTDFESLRVYVRITGAGVVVDQINAVIEGMGELTGRGTVSTADQLDFNLTVKGAPTKGISKVGVGILTKLNGSGGSSGNGSGVPMHVTGTSEEPYITADVGSIVRRGAG